MNAQEIINEITEDEKEKIRLEAYKKIHPETLKEWSRHGVELYFDFD